ncbi:unnamed protein product [Closterium sp. Naga37s-1]|nr:unnamed protein product [Closterium sp. Naga37s-1]
MASAALLRSSSLTACPVNVFPLTQAPASTRHVSLGVAAGTTRRNTRRDLRVRAEQGRRAGETEQRSAAGEEESRNELRPMSVAPMPVAALAAGRRVLVGGRGGVAAGSGKGGGEGLAAAIVPHSLTHSSAAPLGHLYPFPTIPPAPNSPAHSHLLAFPFPPSLSSFDSLPFSCFPVSTFPHPFFLLVPPFRSSPPSPSFHFQISPLPHSPTRQSPSRCLERAVETSNPPTLPLPSFRLPASPPPTLPLPSFRLPASPSPHSPPPFFPPPCFPSPPLSPSLLSASLLPLPPTLPVLFTASPLSSFPPPANRPAYALRELLQPYGELVF